MTHQQFISLIDEKAVADAIREAEARSTGEVRVFVTGSRVSDPLPAAQAEFLRLGMQKTNARNGVLIYVSPRARNFAIVGDEGIHRRAGSGIWQDAAATMRTAFAAEQWTTGLIEAIRHIGDALAAHFPCDGMRDQNELPDSVARDHTPPPA